MEAIGLIGVVDTAHTEVVLDLMEADSDHMEVDSDHTEVDLGHMEECGLQEEANMIPVNLEVFNIIYCSTSSPYYNFLVTRLKLISVH